MATRVYTPKNFSLHGYWIEHKLDDTGEVSTQTEGMDDVLSLVAGTLSLDTDAA